MSEKIKIIKCELCGQHVKVGENLFWVYCDRCIRTKKGCDATSLKRIKLTQCLKGTQDWELVKSRVQEYVKGKKRVRYANSEQREQFVCMLDNYLEEKASRQHIFYGLVDNVSKEHLSVAAFYSENNMIVEFKEAKDYLPINYDHNLLGSISLRKYQRRDRSRQLYCMQRKISYVVIPYNIPGNDIIDFMNYQLENNTTVEVGKFFNFAYAHRLHNELIDDEDNKSIFGKCNSKFGHGHNMKVEVVVKGFVDPLTGMVINFVDLKEIVKKELDILDHTNLNLDFDDYTVFTSTCENMIRILWAKLSIPLPNICKLSLWETDTSICTISRTL